MDLLPTAAALAKAPLPEVILDGINLMPLLDGSDNPQGHKAILHCSGSKPEAIRMGNYKLRETREKQDDESIKITTYLFDLNVDPGEHFNLADRQPERVEMMRQQMTEMAAEMVTNQRPAHKTPKQ